MQMQITDQNWKIILKLFNRARFTSFHYAFATINQDGTPHVSPLASLFLRDDKTGFYFEELTGTMTQNLKLNKSICIMSVNIGKWFWIKSIIKGKFMTPPAVRLNGTAGERRKASPEELKKFKRLVSPFRFFRGYDILWKNMSIVRDIAFDSFEGINAREMEYRFE